MSTLPAYLEKCNQQIDDIVELVRGPLSPGATITIEALVVLDVHGEFALSLGVRTGTKCLRDCAFDIDVLYLLNLNLETDKI